MEQDRTRNQKNISADIALHQTGTLIINVQPENR